MTACSAIDERSPGREVQRVAVLPPCVWNGDRPIWSDVPKGFGYLRRRISLTV